MFQQRPPVATQRPAAQGSAAWRRFWQRYRRNKFAVLGAVIVLLFVMVGLFAPWLAPYSYTEQELTNTQAAPSLAHPFGTDRLGRDQFSRLIWGARTALIVAPATVIVGLTLGLVLGSAAGFFGGWVDQLVMRVSDVLFAFPGLLFAILLAATVQPRIEGWLSQYEALKPFVRSGYAEFFVVIFALSMVGWPGLARLIRGQILALREQPFVEAAHAIGVPPWRILLRHLLPNALTPVIVSVSMGLGGAILAESTLSFFGIGIQPPTASWGAMIFANFSFWRQPSALWLVWAPGLVVGSLVFAFNFIGDGLNEALGR
ncbi:MAG: ABC transporter permease [Anaerolineales bacterium]|nr:ABC transporter permease [Anaerolineales bacterium]MCB9128589.1 ABC transporter permease [Ardenticatenales bacterium]MCB9172527.1 ABC transporter permease [Ardenticatenales bacterium]